MNQRHFFHKTHLATAVLLATALVAAGVVAYISLSPNPEKQNVVHVVFKPNANYLIYFVAREKGFLREAGLDVRETEMESTNLMVQALSSGQADFNPSNSVPALYAAEQNAPGTFKFLYITLMEKGRTNDAIIVSKEAPYTGLRDLRGKTVGSPPGATSLVLLQLIFDAVGVDLDEDLTVQELEPRSLLQALAAGQLDAVFAIEPLITLGEEKGISRVLEAEPMENYVMNPIPIAGGVVTAGFAQANPDTVHKLKLAMERSIDFIRNHEDEARGIMARAIDMPQGTAERLGVNTYWKNSEANRDFVQQLADLFFQHKALRVRVDTSIMYVDTE